jgi:hypothetical protein
LFEQGAHTDGFARRAPVRKREHVVHQRIELLQAAHRSLSAPLEVRAAAVGQRHLRCVQQSGGERRSNLVRKARRQFAHRQQALLTTQQQLHQMRLGDIGQQHHFTTAAQVPA